MTSPFKWSAVVAGRHAPDHQNLTPKQDFEAPFRSGIFVAQRFRPYGAFGVGWRASTKRPRLRRLAWDDNIVAAVCGRRSSGF
jgi:hypothetical protein